jgi:hypothetical protein
MGNNNTSSNNVSNEKKCEKKSVDIKMILLSILAVVTFLLWLYCLCPWGK